MGLFNQSGVNYNAIQKCTRIVVHPLDFPQTDGKINTRQTRASAFSENPVELDTLQDE